MTIRVQDRMDGKPQRGACKGLNVVDALQTWFTCKTGGPVPA